MSIAPTFVASGAAALRQSVRWRLLALLLERPRPGWIDEVRSLASMAGDADAAALAAAAAAATQGVYLSWFAEGGRVSPREVSYRPETDPGRLLADVAAYYDAFAYRPRAEDPIDHVAVEAGFIAYLWLKEALALDAGDAERIAVTAAARRSFMRRHGEPLARAMAEAMAWTEPGSYPRAAVDALARAMTEAEPSAATAPIGPGARDHDATA